jgi:hypothetical protein
MQNVEQSARLAEQIRFMRQQGLVVFGYIGLTTALAVLAPLGGPDTLGYLLIAFACTLGLPVAFLSAWRRSATFRERILALDLAPVVVLMTGRILGLAFLVLYSVGELNGVFAFWGGGIDVFIGGTALTVAYTVLAMRPFPRRVFKAWNLFGFFDFVVAWPIIFLFSPTVVGVLAGSGPTTEAAVTFPMSFVPMFGVPLMATLHLIALLQVRGERVPDVNPLFHRRIEEREGSPAAAVRAADAEPAVR